MKRFRFCFFPVKEPIINLVGFFYYICDMKVKLKPKYRLIYIESDFYNGGIEIIYYLN